MYSSSLEIQSRGTESRGLCDGPSFELPSLYTLKEGSVFLFLSTKGGASRDADSVHLQMPPYGSGKQKKKKGGKKTLVALMIPCTCRKETVCVVGTVPAQKQAQLSKVKQMALDLVPGKH